MFSNLIFTKPLYIFVPIPSCTLKPFKSDSTYFCSGLYFRFLKGCSAAFMRPYAWIHDSVSGNGARNSIELVGIPARAPQTSTRLSRDRETPGHCNLHLWKHSVIPFHLFPSIHSFKPLLWNLNGVYNVSIFFICELTINRFKRKWISGVPSWLYYILSRFQKPLLMVNTSIYYKSNKDYKFST